MGKVFDSTDKFSVFETKARVYKNMSVDNCYLKALQDKVNNEWKYRANIVDIEEEKEFGSNIYEPIEVKIQNVYDEKLKKTLSDDWKKINFKDISYYIPLGRRYRFSLNFNNSEESLMDKSIWITLNTNKTSPTAGGVLRRCDSFLTIISDKGNIHYEPVCLDTDFKYSSIYYDLAISIAQGEIYATMQYNKYTKFLKVNDRFIIGPTDTEDRHNNTIYKIKAIRRYQGVNTFDLNSIPLVFLALDRDDVGAEDDIENRIVKTNGTYREEDFIQKDIDLIEENTQEIPDQNNESSEELIIDKNNLKIEIFSEDGTNINDRILLGDTKKYYCYLFNGEQKSDYSINVETDLLSTENDIYYYDFLKIDGNSFSIFNKKMYLKDELKIRCYYEGISKDILIEKEFLVSLGGLS